MKKLLTIVLALALVLTMTAGCALGETTGAAGGDKSLKLYIAGFQILDPQIWTWGAHACRMGIFEGLTMMNDDFSTRLAQAESLEHNEDYTVWTAKVRQGLKWSDGTPLDANDYYYSFRRVMDPQYLTGKTASLTNTDVSNIILNLNALLNGECSFEDVGVKLIDDYTLEFTLASPCDRFDYRLAESWALPVPQHVIEEYGDDWTLPENIVCNGPFKVASREENVHLGLVKNPEYWDADNVQLKNVEIYSGTQDQFLAYQAGDINVATITASNLDAVLGTEYESQLQYYDTSIITYVGLILSPDSPLVQHPEIREAISLSIDREVLCDQVMMGMRTPATSLIYPGFAPWAGDIDIIDTKANVERAHELMEQAGFPNGEGLGKMTMLVGEDSASSQAFYLALAQMITEGTGIEIDIINQEYASYTAERDSYHTDGMWGIWLDSWNCGVPFASGAFSGYRFDPRLYLLPNEGLELSATALTNGRAPADCQKAFATCTDENLIAYGELYDQAVALGATPEAEEIYKQLEEMRLETYAAIPVCFARAAKLVAPTISGFNGNPTLLDAAPFNFKDVSNG